MTEFFKSPKVGFKPEDQSDGFSHSPRVDLSCCTCTRSLPRAPGPRAGRAAHLAATAQLSFVLWPGSILDPSRQVQMAEKALGRGKKRCFTSLVAPDVEPRKAGCWRVQERPGAPTAERLREGDGARGPHLGVGQEGSSPGSFIVEVSVAPRRGQRQQTQAVDTKGEAGGRLNIRQEENGRIAYDWPSGSRDRADRTKERLTPCADSGRACGCNRSRGWRSESLTPGEANRALWGHRGELLRVQMSCSKRPSNTAVQMAALPLLPANSPEAGWTVRGCHCRLVAFCPESKDAQRLCHICILPDGRGSAGVMWDPNWRALSSHGRAVIWMVVSPRGAEPLSQQPGRPSLSAHTCALL
ncbi:PREDICTED: uncharacterized protein LOC105853322 [Condylura cristata]|uniref:uncharacterized protein LOC105853322 n=1 Tax=Condylura cristata TaxID=143302 RepID=UPI000642F2E7|nr:PREDICTED: uncharacterized protein LOC105853322 [Condylura cristata]